MVLLQIMHKLSVRLKRSSWSPRLMLIMREACKTKKILQDSKVMLLPIKITSKKMKKILLLTKLQLKAKKVHVNGLISKQTWKLTAKSKIAKMLTRNWAIKSMLIKQTSKQMQTISLITKLLLWKKKQHVKAILQWLTSKLNWKKNSAKTMTRNWTLKSTKKLQIAKLLIRFWT